MNRRTRKMLNMATEHLVPTENVSIYLIYPIHKLTYIILTLIILCCRVCTMHMQIIMLWY